MHFRAKDQRGPAQGPNSWIKSRKVLKVFLLAIRSQLYSFALNFYFFKLTQLLTVSSSVTVLYAVKEKGGKPYPPSLWFKKYRILRSENSQDYAQKFQRNCMFMNQEFDFTCRLKLKYQGYNFFTVHYKSNSTRRVYSSLLPCYTARTCTAILCNSLCETFAA